LRPGEIIANSVQLSLEANVVVSDPLFKVRIEVGNATAVLVNFASGGEEPGSEGEGERHGGADYCADQGTEHWPAIVCFLEGR
jgi:hypothetical protein